MPLKLCTPLEPFFMKGFPYIFSWMHSVPELRKNVIGVRYWSQEGDMWPETMADLVWAVECADFYLFSEKER